MQTTKPFSDSNSPRTIYRNDAYCPSGANYFKRPHLSPTFDRSQSLASRNWR